MEHNWTHFIFIPASFSFQFSHFVKTSDEKEESGESLTEKLINQNDLPVLAYIFF